MKIGMLNYGRVIMGLTAALSGCGTGIAQLKAADAVSHTVSHFVSAADVATHIARNQERIASHSSNGEDVLSRLKERQTTNPAAFWQAEDDSGLVFKDGIAVCTEKVEKACKENDLPDCFKRFKNACQSRGRFFMRDAGGYFRAVARSFELPKNEPPKFISRIPGDKAELAGKTKSPEAFAQLQRDIVVLREANEKGNTICKSLAENECDKAKPFDDPELFCTDFVKACEAGTDATEAAIFKQEDEITKALLAFPPAN